jgi:hypothetical protein
METTGPADGTLTDLLRDRAAAKFAGALRVDGRPGGTIFFADGRITACETSGAPSAEVILLRSQRVAVSDWDAAFTAAAVDGRAMAAELVDRELLGAGELEALLRTTLADAVFALANGHIDGWTEAPAAECLLPLVPAVGSGWLLNEAMRRRQVLASFAEPAAPAEPAARAPRARDRIAAGPAAARALLGPGQDEILALVDGRRTARDLAFALGRGLYETMLQVARMQAADVVLVRSSPEEPGPRAEAVPDGNEGDRTPTGLPRRRKDRPSPPRSEAPGRRNLAASIRMLLPRSDGNTAEVQ